MNDSAAQSIRTWDDLRGIAKQHTRRNSNGSVAQAGISLGTGYNVSNSPDILSLMFAQSNVKVPDALNTVAAKAALEYYSAFVRSDKVWSSDLPYSTEAFATEKSVMAFVRAEEINYILQINPSLRIGVIPIPQVPQIGGGTTQITWANFWVESVSADATPDQQKAAWKFLNWLAEPEQQIALYTNTSELRKVGRIPSNKSIANNFRTITYIGPYIEQAPLAETSVAVDHAGNSDFAGILKDLMEKASNGQDSITILKAAKLEWEAQ